MKPIQTGDVVGDYRVIDIAGSGGMGAVYKIEHVISKRIEAMKRLPPGLSSDPEQVRRFEREIQVQARLHHPNIVELYTAVRDGSSIALVMEFVEGESLLRKLEAGPLPVQTAVEFACQVLCALEYAHQAGVIHRDVAPANIIITPEGIAKLTDFGLALGATDLRLSASGVPVGSPWYMSPEQVKGTGVFDARTDLYAMGAVLHEMLTGAKLFEGESSFAVMRAHVEAAPEPPSSRNPAVPAALDDVVRKAVAKDPAMRFQSAEQFRLALHKAVASRSPVASPWRNGRRAVMLMALVPAVLVAGIYTVRFFPAAARVHVTVVKPGPAAVSERHAPPLTIPAPTATPAALPATAPAVADVVAQVVAPAHHRAQVPAVAMRRTGKPEQSYAIRVTGGEVERPVVVPAPVLTAREMVTAEAPAPAAVAVVSTSAPESSATPHEAAPVKTQAAGNRLLRALGKVNPFRKGAKHDAAKTPLK